MVQFEYIRYHAKTVQRRNRKKVKKHERNVYNNNLYQNVANHMPKAFIKKSREQLAYKKDDATKHQCQQKIRCDS